MGSVAKNSANALGIGDQMRVQENGFFYIRNPSEQREWSCSYCGGLRSAELHQCPGCGAARKVV